jgi:hypothetical protein
MADPNERALYVAWLHTAEGHPGSPQAAICRLAADVGHRLDETKTTDVQDLQDGQTGDMDMDQEQFDAETLILRAGLTHQFQAQRQKQCEHAAVLLQKARTGQRGGPRAADLRRSRVEAQNAAAMQRLEEEQSIQAKGKLANLQVQHTARRARRAKAALAPGLGSTAVADELWKAGVVAGKAGVSSLPSVSPASPYSASTASASASASGGGGGEGGDGDGDEGVGGARGAKKSKKGKAVKGENGPKMNSVVCFAVPLGVCTKGDWCRFALEGAVGGVGKHIAKATVRGGRCTLPT